MSQAAPPQVPMPAPPTEPEPEPPKRRRGVIAAAIAVVLIIVAGLAAFAITRSDTAEAQPLALSFTQGEEKTYDVHQTMDANISSPLFGDEPLSMDVSQVVGWKVVSVDDAGTATIEVTVSDMSGTLNGSEVPSTPAPPIEIQIASDGRVLSAGGLSLGGAAETQGFGFPGMGQLTPILPDDGDAVSVGDTWDKEFSQDFPFGDGTIDFSATSTYVRNETVNGREAAVIQTQMTVPIDVTLDLAKLLDALGPEITGATGARRARRAGRGLDRLRRAGHVHPDQLRRPRGLRDAEDAERRGLRHLDALRGDPGPGRRAGGDELHGLVQPGTRAPLIAGG